MKRFLVSIPIVVLIVMLVNFLEDKTYSNYKKGINVNINDTTGKMVCDSTLDNPGTYVSNDGWAYFIVTVKNYDTEDVTSDVPVEYNINVTNAEGSDALYRISTGTDVGTFADDTTSQNYQFTTGSKQTREFMVEVKTTGQAAEDVDFNVDLNCYQVSN